VSARPQTTAKGTGAADVRVPGSKSMTLRAMVAGGLGKGETLLKNASLCEDTRVMAESLKRLGVSVRHLRDRFVIRGCNGGLKNPRCPLDLGNSGAPLRFLTAVVALGQGPYVITGNDRMRERPIQPLLDALKELGVNGYPLEDTGAPPLSIEACGIRGGTARLGGEASSQFLSAILLVSPFARDPVHIEVTGRLVSRPYVDMTLGVMKSFGVEVERAGYGRFDIAPQQPGYRATDYPIEGDWSSASYFFSLGAITGKKVRVHGLNPDSLQGDRGFLGILEKMGCGVSRQDEWIEVRGGTLRGTEVEMGDMPDLVPSLAVVASFARGETVISGVPHLRLKESDRIRALAAELNKLGIRIKERADGLVIQGGRPSPAPVTSHGDHRMAMALGVMGAAVGGVEIKGADCVDKSYPDFWRDLKRAAR
jgi:3-phosphoshikimate 1-carboxyvinyltransferase